MALLRYILGLLFILAGAWHFINPAIYLRIMPSWLPWHEALIYISGACEILGGAGLMVKATRVYASWGLILLLLAVFPANINMLQNAQQFPSIPEVVLWLRLPLQLVLIALVWWCGCSPNAVVKRDEIA